MNDLEKEFSILRAVAKIKGNEWRDIRAKEPDSTQRETVRIKFTDLAKALE